MARKHYEWKLGDLLPELGHHSLAKHRILRRYIERYIEIVTATSFQEQLSLTFVADLLVKGGSVTGNWEEKTYAAKGEVTGRHSGENFALNIKGASFTASMNVALSACKQFINITPKGLDVTRVTIGLSKC